MGRRMRVGRVALVVGAALAALGLSLLLAACQGEFDLLEAITTEVKVANDKFLEVVSVDPTANATGVPQSRRIAIKFDRPLALSSIAEDGVLFAPELAIGWTHQYEPLINTLYVYADPSLAQEQDYVVTVTGVLKGADGSVLQDDYSWNFRTGLSATGNFFMEGLGDADGDDAAADGYTNSPTGTVKLYVYDDNIETDEMKWGYSEEQVLQSSGWVPFAPQVSSVPLQEAGMDDGTKTIYMGFSDGSALPAASELKMRTIVLDRVDPVVSPSNKTFNASTSFPARVYAITSDDRSGIESWEWTKISGPGVVTFSDAGIEDPWVASVSLDGTYTLELDVEDRAGNEASDTMTLTVDRVYPTAPSITVPDPDPYYATRDTTPTWTWVSMAGDGSGTFAFHLDSGGDDKDDVTSFTPPSALSYGTHTLYVAEFDDAGNLSEYASAPIAVSTVIPPDRYGNTPRDTRFEWPAYRGAEEYDLYGWVAGGHPAKLTTVTTNEFQPPLLPADEDMYWYYEAYDVFLLTRTLRYTSPTYRFTTAK